MSLVPEFHPFADGNGRVARLPMNAELSAAGLCRVMIPPVYRDEYLAALRALSQNGNPTRLWRMVDRAQRWAALMPWTSRDRVLELMTQTNALATPEEAATGNLHLRDSSAHARDLTPGDRPLSPPPASTRRPPSKARPVRTFRNAEEVYSRRDHRAGMPTPSRQKVRRDVRGHRACGSSVPE